MLRRDKYNLLYKTQVAPFFPVCLIAVCYNRGFWQLLGLKLRVKEPIIVIIKNDTCYWFLPKAYKRASAKVFKRFFFNHVYLQKIKTAERKLSKILLAEIKEPSTNFYTHGLLNSSGEKKLKRLFAYYYDYAYFVNFLGFLFQNCYLDKFRQEIFNDLRNLSEEKKDKIFQNLLLFDKSTNYEKFLLALSGHVFSTEKAADDLKKIERDFYWLIHDYFGEIIDNQYLKNEIRKLQKQKGTLKKEIKNIIQRPQKIKKAEMLLPKNLRLIIKSSRELLFIYHEKKKATLSRVNIYIRRVIEAGFPQKSVQEIRQIFQLSPSEIVNLLKGEQIKNLEKRSSAWTYVIGNEQIKTGDKKYLRWLEVSPKTKANILRGTPASPGVVEGRANQVLDIGQIKNFPMGDILVAPQTNVNYLPILRKAKAVLTEIGGLTSHAAIVSRELHIPCIVGIPNLLTLIKDGSMVKVNAKEGTITVLN